MIMNLLLNEVREKTYEGPIPYPLETRMIISHKDSGSFKRFLQYIVDDAKPFRFTPITNNFNCYVCANGKWANISDGAYREIIELVLFACQSNDPSILTEALQ